MEDYWYPMPTPRVGDSTDPRIIVVRRTTISVDVEDTGQSNSHREDYSHTIPHIHRAENRPAHLSTHINSSPSATNAELPSSPVTAGIEDGEYVIVNVKHGGRLALPCTDSTAQVFSSFAKGPDTVWRISRYRHTDKYTIVNVQHKMFAGVSLNPDACDTIIGDESPCQWRITPVHSHDGQFLIASLEDHMYWGIIEGELPAPIGLKVGSDKAQNHWKFISLTD